MLSRINKLIFTAITIEIVGALVLASLFYTVFFGLKETVDIFQWLCFPLLMACAITYAFGWFIGNHFSARYQFKKWQGVIIMFALLLVSIFGGMLTLSISANNDINEITDVFPVVLLFLAFGGLPTLIWGLWLGSRLSKLNPC